VTDMGGTSFEAALVDGSPVMVNDGNIDRLRIALPMLGIHTIGAGGGSVGWIDEGGLLRVGPQSAGAHPGPACYGMGGPLTLSDVNLLLGRLQPDRFPIPIVGDAARAALADVRTRLTADQAGLTDEELLEGFLRIANERMADAIRQVSLRRGHDPATHALVAFGGAGGQHACDVASMLGITRVLIPPRASLLSAEGLAQAVIERIAERQLLVDLESHLEELEEDLTALEQEAQERVAAEGVTPARIARRLAELRFAGQDSTLDIDIYGVRALPHSFRHAYRELFGPRAEALAVYDHQHDHGHDVGGEVVQLAGEAPAVPTPGAQPGRER